MSKILQSNGFKIDKKSLEFKTLRKRVIELKLLRYKHKKDFISGGVFNNEISLNGFIEECNRTFNLDFLDEKVKELYVFKSNSTEVKYNKVNSSPVETKD